jgi:hypothetical protein
MNTATPELIPFLLCAAAVLIIIAYKLKRNRNFSDASLKQIINDAGYAYDYKQDIFYSRKDAWQKGFGYSRIYDEAAAPMGMIIDCEPVHFDYGGKKWLIELWKGQYGITTGCEIGIYLRDDAQDNGKEMFYKCADDEEQLYMIFKAKKNGKVLFTRRGRHWWLTGFLPGEFSNPDELSMDVRITLLNRDMCTAFVLSLNEIGYAKQDIKVIGNTVWFHFSYPLSPQPVSRTPIIEKTVQKKNQLLCNQYLRLTKEYERTPEKIAALREKAPGLYRLAINFKQAAKEA